MKIRLTSIAVGLLVLLVLACDESSSPTSPETPQVSNTSSASVTVQLCSGADSTCPALRGSLQLGQSMTIFIVVTSDTDPAPTEAGINTTLGDFGTDSSGEAITEMTVSLSGTNSLRSASVTFSAGTAAGTASILANVGSITSATSVTLTEAPPLFLQSVSPNVGAANGGNQVTIAGQGFEDGSRIAFGGVQADPPTSVTDSTLVVTVPPPETAPATGETLVVDVSVTNPPASSSESSVTDTLPKAYTYTQGGSNLGPTIISVVPGVGENSGGTTVTISGNDFPSAADAFVAFGIGDTPSDFAGLQATLVSASDTEIVVTTPPAGATLRNQTVDVLVRDQSTGLATLAQNAFTYGSQDLVLDILPRELSYLGSQTCDVSTGTGDCVTITAQGLPADMPMVSVEFGGVFQTSCPSNGVCSVSTSGSTATLVVAARSVSVQDCSPPSGGVTLTDQQTGETSSGPVFSYTAELPIVTGASPATGVQGGGESVDLSGTFSADETATSTVVLIGGVQASVESYGETEISVSTPAFTGTFNQVACGTDGLQQVPTAVDVEVRYPGSGCSGTGTGAFTYNPDNTDCIESTQAELPAADFSFIIGSTVSPPPPCDPSLYVRFFDESTGDPTSWLWDFDDGDTSTQQNPAHCYPNTGTANVELTVTNDAGSSTVTKQVVIE